MFDFYYVITKSVTHELFVKFCEVRDRGWRSVKILLNYCFLLSVDRMNFSFFSA